MPFSIARLASVLRRVAWSLVGAWRAWTEVGCFERLYGVFVVKIFCEWGDEVLFLGGM